MSIEHDTSGGVGIKSSSGGIVLRLSILGTSLSALTVVPVRHYVLEINSNLFCYYLAAHLISIPVLMFFWGTFPRWYRRAMPVLMAVLILFYGSVLAPFYLPVDAEQSGERTARLLYANLNIDYSKSKDFTQLIYQHDPDILVFLEYTSRWESEFSHELQAFPHRVTIPRDDFFGIALFSKFPLIGEAVTELGTGVPPVILAKLDFGEGVIVDGAFVHAIPPMGDEAYWLNRVLARRVATHLRNSDRPVLFAGDLNATPISRFYRKIYEGPGLKSAMEGQGMLRTWNSFNPLVRLTLDHVLYRSLSVKQFKRLPAWGSDHYPLFVELRY